MSENKFDVRNTRDGVMSEELKNVIETQEEHYKDHLVGGIALVNLDVKPDEMPSGLVTFYEKDAPINSTSIPNELGQYLMVTEIAPRKGGYNDEYFQSLDMKKRLDENVPQFNENPPKYSIRHPHTNSDTDVWGPELGPTEGMVGVFKVMEPNGRDARYYLAVKSSIPEVTHKLKQDIARSPGVTTFGDILDDPRVHFVDYLGRRNGYRLLYAAKKALGVDIPHGQDKDHYIPPTEECTAYPMRAEPEHIQAMTSIKPITQGGRERVAVYSGVTPAYESAELHHTYVSPYDGIVRFHMNGSATGLALPSATGKTRDSSKINPNDHKDEIQHRAIQSSIIWEGETPNHIDLAPGVHHLVDKQFLRSMQQSGWKRENERTHMIPVLVKISNAELKRE